MRGGKRVRPKSGLRAASNFLVSLPLADKGGKRKKKKKKGGEGGGKGTVARRPRAYLSATKLRKEEGEKIRTGESWCPSGRDPLTDIVVVEEKKEEKSRGGGGRGRHREYGAPSPNQPSGLAGNKLGGGGRKRELAKKTMPRRRRARTGPSPFYLLHRSVRGGREKMNDVTENSFSPLSPPRGCRIRASANCLRC